MEVIDTAQRKLAKALGRATRPVVLCGFGKDSVLLLWLALSFHPAIDVLWLRSDLLPGQRRFAESLIAGWRLTVYGYQPADRHFLHNPAGGLTLVNEYDVSGERLPVLLDVEEGERCALDLTSARTPRFLYPWDVTLVGWKAADDHPILGRNPFPEDGAALGGSRLFAPLRHMTDAEVWRATRALQLPYDKERYDEGAQVNPDALYACTRCIGGGGAVFCPKENREIEAARWDDCAASLRAFRSRFAPHLTTGDRNDDRI